MPAVSNTSPIFNLACIDRLYLLRMQFGAIWIPSAVDSELAPDSRRHRPFPSRRRIIRLSLFGSMLTRTGGARADSDIDLLVEFEPSQEPGLLGLAEMEMELASLLIVSKGRQPRRVDTGGGPTHSASTAALVLGTLPTQIRLY